MTKQALKDSGKREDFSTGSVRDKQEGKGAFHLVPMFVTWLLGCVYEDGAIKYACRNWEKGQPLSQYLKSCMNHISKHMMGMRDEPHILQAIWNLYGYVFTAAMIKIGKRPAELNDMWDQFEDKPADPLGPYEATRLTTYFQGEFEVTPGWDDGSEIVLETTYEMERPPFFAFGGPSHVPEEFVDGPMDEPVAVESAVDRFVDDFVAHVEQNGKVRWQDDVDHMKPGTDI